jgi:drug/metabolite transporter (DMT)-like permease
LTRLRPYFPELALALAAALYGSTFILVQDSLDHVSPSGFNLLRFGVATVVLVPWVVRRDWRGPEVRVTDSVRTLATGGVALGVAGLVAYQTQNVGLDHTSTSNASFITGLFVVFTPLIVSVRDRRWPRPAVTAAVLCSLLGLFLLTGASFSVSYGDGVTVITAFAWAVWLIGTDAMTRRFDTFALIILQVATIGVGSAVITALTGFGEVTLLVVVAVLVTGIGCSAVAFCLSAWAQRMVDPERTGVISLLEPVVAGIIGFSVGERLGVAGYVGAVLILTGIYVVERGTHPAGPYSRPPRCASVDRAPSRAGSERGGYPAEYRSRHQDVTRVTRS